MSQTHKKVNLIFEPVDVWQILDKAWKLTPKEIIDQITESGLRGRGGAGFPTGLKWNNAAMEQDEEKYIICNADEGEPGTFKDRAILEKRFDKVLAGLLIGAHAIGAQRGFVYLRGEYNYLLPTLEESLADFQKEIQKRNMKFTIKIRSGSGAYVCGEETSLIESMEGKRGEPRNKPPFPIKKGYLNKPTVVNNAETLVYAMSIIHDGPTRFKELGSEFSRGSKVFCVSGDASQEGIFELEFGMSIAEFVDMFGDGDTKAVQVGGSSGFCVPRKNFKKTILGFEGIPTGGSMMLFNSSRSMYHILHNYLEFFEEESCGQCTPCRVGCQELKKGIEAVKSGNKPQVYLETLLKLAQTMKLTSKCGLGQSVPNSFISIVQNFCEEIIY